MWGQRLLALRRWVRDGVELCLKVSELLCQGCVGRVAWRTRVGCCFGAGGWWQATRWGASLCSCRSRLTFRSWREGEGFAWRWCALSLCRAHYVCQAEPCAALCWAHGLEGCYRFVVFVQQYVFGMLLGDCDVASETLDYIFAEVCHAFHVVLRSGVEARVVQYIEFVLR